MKLKVTYSLWLWNLFQILESFQSKALRMITDAPWHAPNVILRQDLRIPSVKEEIRRFSIQYSSRLQTHPNSLAVHLMDPPEHRRLKRHLPTDFKTKCMHVVEISVVPHVTPSFCHY
jgi:hypothetical protein